MYYDLIHIVPFDMGVSFLGYENMKKNAKEEYLDGVGRLFAGCAVDQKDGHYLCVVKISDHVECRMFNFGIGVFVIRGLPEKKKDELDAAFPQSFACPAYYKKKTEQRAILHGDTDDPEIAAVFDAMRKIWSLQKGSVRPFSSNEQYRSNGLSYVLTVYHIADRQIELQDNKQLDLLMNPVILNEILNEDKWSSINARVNAYRPVGYQEEPFNDSSSVIASWSAVAVVEKKATALLDSIIRYEVDLQSAWFLFDALIDNLNSGQLSDLELQRYKSTATDVYLDISNTLSANMSTSQKRSKKIIYDTSGLEEIKEKCILLLENRINIEQAKQSSQRAVDGMVSEILLVAFTLIQIYEPLKNMVKGVMTREDLIVGAIVLAALAVSSFFIIRKDR